MSKVEVLRMHRWKVVPIYLVLAVAAACSGPARGPAQDTQPGVQPPGPPKRITAAIRGAPASLVQNRTYPPQSSGSVPGLDALEELVHAGLSHWNGEGRLVPQLGEAVPTIENGLWEIFPDGRMETTWKIRPAARWHDGTRVSAGDLIFTTTIEQDREVGIPRNAVYDLIDAIEALDDSTVRVTWKRPYIEADALFSYRVALPMPRHLLETTYLNDKENVLGGAYWSQEFVGAGPYRVQEWAPDSHVVLQAYDNYVLGRPKVDAIEVKFIPDPTTLMANVLAGVELTIGRALSFDQAIQLRDQWRDGGAAVRPGAALPIMPQFINPSPPVVADLRFRRALLHGIDRQQIVDTMMAGQAQIAHSFVSPADPAFPTVDPRSVRYDHDPRRAIQMIEGLRYTRAADGFFFDATNRRLSVQINTAAQNDRNPKVTAAVAGFWQQIGVEVEQVILPIQRFQDVEDRAQFPAFDITQTAGDTGAGSIRRYHSASTPLPENQFRLVGNSSRYRNPELDAFLDRYLTTIPLQERWDALAGMVHHQTENLTMMPLFFDVAVTMVSKRLQNVTARGAVTSEAWNAHEWDVR